MSANHPSAASQPRETKRPIFSVWGWILVALVLGVALGGAIALLHQSGGGATLQSSTLPGRPVATWAAGARRAPGFRLVDDRGAPISLDQFRGKPVIVTFIDPVCRTLCPLEAKELNRAVAATPPARRPVIVAVSVNPWAHSRANFLHDQREWRLVPQWRWAAGRYAQLAPVWRSYKIGVLAKKKVIVGVTVRDVSHTEASYVLDRDGYERALFLYPFRGRDVAAVLSRLSSSRS